MKLKKLVSLLMACVMLMGSALAVNESNIIAYTGAYDAEQYPAREISAVFTEQEVTVDGKKEDAYGEGYAFGGEDGAASGTLYIAWNGPVLYLLVEVKDETPAATEEAEAALGANPAFPAQADSVTFGIDLYNDKVVYETDTIGTFNVDVNGALHYYRNAFIPSLGSVMGDPIHPEYQNRILGYAAAAEGDSAYTVEVAFDIEAIGADNDSVLGIEVQLNDAVSYEKLPAAEGETVAEGAVARVVNHAFLSHAQTELYAAINDSSPNCLDWANLTLAGKPEGEAGAFSTWRIDNTLRYLDSIAFPKEVYTAESQAALDAARAEAQQALIGAEGDMAVITAAADKLDEAIRALRWADTRYPDPDEFEDVMTLPNPYQFFQSERTVKTKEDWEERRKEILDLAQFYEYGYKPAAPLKSEIVNVTHYNPGDSYTTLLWGFWEYTVNVTNPMDIITLAITDGGVTAQMDFTVYLPTAEQLAASGHTQGGIPVLLSYDGSNDAYLNAGIAVVQVPAGSAGDSRTNEYAWGTRSGAFYELYPYSRNGEGALKEVSSEMAAAWAASRVIDALEKIGEYDNEYTKEIDSLIDPAKLAVTGFSINGKYAFVAAVFDERIGICIPGAAGASGPSPWRYVYTGHVYDWTGTDFAPKEGQTSSPVQVAFGTEVMANSVRHNRVRETELFRQFLTAGNFYKRLPGAYGFGTRLPYDQNDLIATLAPRAIVLVNTVNDCNDGSEADALGLEVTKSVYSALGYDADALVRFNYRGVQDGEPHGTDPVQYQRNAAYINSYYMGEALSEETDAWLSTDPFMLNICDGQTATPFDYYYGGFDTITGGDGENPGWYFYTIGE